MIYIVSLRARSLSLSPLSLSLKNNTAYGGAFSGRSPTIIAFWTVVREDLSEDERHKLLQFVTGSAHVPIGGFGCLLNKSRKKTPFKIRPKSSVQVTALGIMGAIPEAHTCFNTLELPVFGDDRARIKEVLELLLTGEQDGFSRA